MALERSLGMKCLPLIAVLVVTFLSWGCSDEATVRSDLPATRAAVSKVLDLPLPASAHSIYYLMFGGGMQDLEFFARFDVDPKDLDAAVDGLVAWNNKQMGRALAYPRSPLSAATPPTPRCEFLPMGWWDPPTISTGYYRGHDESYALKLFVDQTRSRIYLYQND